MRVFANRITIISICIGLLVLLCNYQVQGQEKPFNLDDLMGKLSSAPHGNKSSEEINKQLIEDVRRRKVNFILSSEGEVTLKNSGANNLLISAINENATEQIKKDLVEKLYDIFSTEPGADPLEKDKIALELSKKYLRVFGNSKDNKEIVDYLKQAIPALEQKIIEKAQRQKLNKILTQAILENIHKDEAKKNLFSRYLQNYFGSIQQKKIALEAAKEFVEKYSEETEIKSLINYFREIIPVLEKEISSLQ